VKEKKGNNLGFYGMDLCKKMKETTYKVNKNNSSSKQSNKSTSFKTKNIHDHSNSSKTKSRSNKKHSIKNNDKKSKLVDTQKIYFDETPELH
jgi:hypothetical protein